MIQAAQNIRPLYWAHKNILRAIAERLLGINKFRAAANQNYRKVRAKHTYTAQHLNSIILREMHVHDEDIRMQPCSHFHRLQAIRCLSHNTVPNVLPLYELAELPCHPGSLYSEEDRSHFITPHASLSPFYAGSFIPSLSVITKNSPL